jgi:uncharacterized protein YbjQ (UPF0145 family)
MTFKQLMLVSSLCFACATATQAADTVYNIDFKSAVEKAVADGFLDGSVKFYLAGTKSGGRVLEKDIVSNKKTNGFGKPAEKACDHVLRSALIQMQNAAKAQGGNSVTNIVSYFKSNESKNKTTYQCFKGTAIASVALKGDIVKF